MTKKADAKKKKTTTSRTTGSTVPSKPRSKRKSLLNDIDIRELAVLLIAGNFIIDGIIMLILITKLYL